MSIKIEKLRTKYPIKINGEIVEFGTEDIVIKESAYEVANKILYKDSGELRGVPKSRSVISIDEQSYWALTLMGRLARRQNKRNFSVSSIIDIFMDQFKNDSYKDNIGSNNYWSGDEAKSNKTSKDDPDMDYENLHAYFKRVLVYSEKNNQNFFDEEGTCELFIPQITYHKVNLLREILLAMIAPELSAIQSEMILWEVPFMRNFPSDINEENATNSDFADKVQNWALNCNDSIVDMIKEYREIARTTNGENFSIDQDIGKEYREAIQKKLRNSMREFGNITEIEIDNFHEQFSALREVAPKLGKYSFS